MTNGQTDRPEDGEIHKGCGRQAAAPGTGTVAEKSSNIERVSMSKCLSSSELRGNSDIVLAFSSQYLSW